VRLYNVTTVVRRHRGFKDVVFNWFVREPYPAWQPRLYAELIQDYDPRDHDNYLPRRSDR
jgi:hypothetical protein